MTITSRRVTSETTRERSEKKLDELRELIEDIEVAMLTTRRPDGSLVSRPMATQEATDDADLWFVTNIETDKVDELQTDPSVNLAYYDGSSREWVSVSGTAVLTLDREKIRALHQPDWKIWFEDQGGARDGGPDDPRLGLIFVDAHSVRYLKTDASKPQILFEVAKARLTGGTPELGRAKTVDTDQLD